MDIHPAQLRAARALVGWSREQLAEAVQANPRTIARIEDGETVPRGATVEAIRSALEQAGVVFLAAGGTVDGGPGVRLRRGHNG